MEGSCAHPWRCCRHQYWWIRAEYFWLILFAVLLSFGDIMKSLFTLYSLWATETGSAVKEMGQIAHKNIRTITFLLMDLTMLWVAPSSAPGVTRSAGRRVGKGCVRK